jgi:hypothetical protein
MDNHHVQIRPLTCSCGGVELAQLSETPTPMLYALANYFYHPSRSPSPAAFVIWSDLSGENTRGYNLYLEIRKCLGDGGIIIEPSMENPKTSNIISFYFWSVPHESFRTWWLKERLARASKVRG